MFKLSLACLATLTIAKKWKKGEKEFLRGSEYKKLDASEKHALAMEDLREHKETAPYNYEMEPFFEQRSNFSTCNTNDELKKSRNKLAHQQGTVASVQYESVGDHPYTGFFAKGADYAVLRLSDSGFIVDGHESSNPSLAVKFFSTGVESANIVLMIDWNNQNTLNFFPKDDEGNFKPFTNHPPLPKDDCSRMTQIRKITEASRFPLSSGVSSVSYRDTEGGIKGNEDDDLTGYKYPFEVQFIPNEAAIPAYAQGTHPMDYLASITQVPGEPLFEAYARENPGSDLQHIGNLWLEEDMYRSLFGDTKLFFQHDHLGRDAGRLRKSGDKATARLWDDVGKEQQETLLPEWGDTDIPAMPSDMTPKEVIEGGILGTLGEEGLTGCPFAWMLLQ